MKKNKLIDIINTDEEPNILGDKNFDSTSLFKKLSKIIYSNHDKVPFDDIAEQCEQLFIKEMIEVLEQVSNKGSELFGEYNCYGSVINKIKEFKTKLKQIEK